MEIKKTTISGLLFDIEIEEVNERDNLGRLLCYLATLYRLDQKNSVRRILRRSRIPGTAEAMRREFERDGIQAFRRLEQPTT